MPRRTAKYHQPSVLSLLMVQSSKVEPDRVVRGFAVHMEKTCLFKTDIYLRYSLKGYLLSAALKSRLNRPGPWTPSALPGCVVVAIYEQAGFCLPKDKGLLCAKWGADLHRRGGLYCPDHCGAPPWKALSPYLSGWQAATGKAAKLCQVQVAGLYRMSFYLLFECSIFDELAQKHLIYSYERTLLMRSSSS